MKVQEMEIEISVSTESEMRRFKKTRRGKKRRLKPFSEDSESPSHSPTSNYHNHQFTESENDNQKESMSIPLRNPDPLELESTSEETAFPVATISTPHCAGSGNQKRLLRPLEVPKAPNNSTQFIMDDHENCNLYLSFESPSRYKRRRRSTGASSGNEYCTSPCMGYHDIDYEYESPDDLDSTAFFEKDFEMIYSRAREEELVTLSRNELISQLIELEGKANSYEQLLSSGDVPSVASLQEELLKLQEENALLRKTNLYLKVDALITDDEDEDDDLPLSNNSSSAELTSTTANTATTTDSSDEAESEVCDSCCVNVENKEDDDTRIDINSSNEDLAVNVT